MMHLTVDDVATSIYCFVLDHRYELRSCGVIPVLGVHSSSQAFYVQVLHADAVEPVHDPARYLVRTVAPPIGDALVAPFRALLAAGERALKTTQLFLALPGEILIRLCAPVRLGNQSRQPDVETKCIEIRALASFNFAVKDGVPVAALTGGDCRCRLAGQVPMPANLDCAWNAGDTDASILNAEAVANAKHRRVKPQFGCESGKTSTTFAKRWALATSEAGCAIEARLHRRSHRGGL
jgi:hypothetical protein